MKELTFDEAIELLRASKRYSPVPNEVDWFSSDGGSIIATVETEGEVSSVVFFETVNYPRAEFGGKEALELSLIGKT